MQSVRVNAIPLCGLALLSGSLLFASVTEVTLSPSATPTSADPVATSVTVVGHGFPAGTISPAKVTVTLKPATAGSGPTGATTATGVTVVSGSTERVTFKVPKSISVPAATPYAVSIAGTTSTGAAFQSSNTAALTVNALVAITTSSPLPTGTVGANYSQTLSATGGTGQYTWQVSSGSLPGGLTLNSSTGQIAGQPTTAGTSYALLKVTDSDQSSTSKQFTLAIDPPLAITTASPLPTGTVGVTYSQTFTATGGSGQYTWSVSAGALPGGLTLNAVTGALTGQPTTAGAPSFTIKVTDSTQATATKAFTVTIDPPLLITTTSPLPAGEVGNNYSDTLTATGGSGQYTWSVSAGSLPAGLTLTPATGVIAGLPTTAATSNFTIQVTDTNQVTASLPVGLTINAAAQITSLAPKSANAGVSLQVVITGSNTHFVQGTTQANFGPGVTVTSVTVAGLTSATAQISVSSSAVVESQTVTVTTGTEVATLTNGFTILAAIPVIDITSATATPLAPGFSGFDDEYLINGVEYWDPKYIAMVQPLKPGWIRYPSGTPSMAFDWETAHMNLAWMSELSPLIGTYFTSALKDAQILTQAKSGANFSDYGTLLQTVGANGIVVFNGYTDTNTNSAYDMVQQAKSQGSNIVEWELDNEPYVYPTIYATPAAYCSAMYSPYYTNIVAANPTATTGVFYQGEFNWQQGDYIAWDDGMTAYSPKYWNGVSFHVYPVTDTTIGTTDEEQTLNGILAYGTTQYFSSYIEPLIGPTMPVFITELNSGPATMEFETYIYNAIFLTEYIARMSTIPQVKAVGVSELYLGNSYNEGMIRAVDDFESYLFAQVAADPSYSTNTATNPDTQFSFYYSTNALALEIANQAFNGSSGVWPTSVYGSPTVPIIGYDGNPVPAVYAQGYQGAGGTNYLLITNKSGSPVPAAIEFEGNLLETTLSVSYISSTSDTAQNTATDQNNVRIVTTTSPNPITIGPYSVTLVQW